MKLPRDSLPGLFLPTGKYHVVSVGERPKVDTLGSVESVRSVVATKPSILQVVATRLGLSVRTTAMLCAATMGLVVGIIGTIVLVVTSGEESGDATLISPPSHPSPSPPSLCPTWSTSPSIQTHTCSLGGSACSMGQYDGYMVAAPAGTMLVGSGVTTACSLV